MIAAMSPASVLLAFIWAKSGFKILCHASSGTRLFMLLSAKIATQRSASVWCKPWPKSSTFKPFDQLLKLINLPKSNGSSGLYVGNTSLSCRFTIAVGDSLHDSLHFFKAVLPTSLLGYGSRSQHHDTS